MNALVSKFLANRHTSGAAVAYLIIELGQQVLSLWLPAHADQIYETARLFSKGVVGYGLIMAGDAKAPLTPSPQYPTSPE